MDTDRRLILNIIATTVTLFLIQCATLVFLIMYYSIVVHHTIWIFPILLVVHILITIILVFLRSNFYVIDSGKKLERINLTNWLSMFRISVIPTIIFLLVNIRRYNLVVPAIILLFLAFFTDFVDGKLARYLHQSTQIGQYIDSWSDYIILIIITVLFLYYRLISIWFFLVVVVRLVIPIIGIGVLFFRTGYTQYYSSRIGKSSIFAIMALFALSLGLVAWDHARYTKLFISILEIITVLGFVLPAIIERTRFLTTLYRERTEAQK